LSCAKHGIALAIGRDAAMSSTMIRVTSRSRLKRCVAIQHRVIGL